MHEACPSCGLQFNRGEQGYYIGAMYVSYLLSIPPVLALVVILLRIPGQGEQDSGVIVKTIPG